MNIIVPKLEVGSVTICIGEDLDYLSRPGGKNSSFFLPSDSYKTRT